MIARSECTIRHADGRIRKVTHRPTAISVEGDWTEDEAFEAISLAVERRFDATTERFRTALERLARK